MRANELNLKASAYDFDKCGVFLLREREMIINGQLGLFSGMDTSGIVALWPLSALGCANYFTPLPLNQLGVSSASAWLNRISPTPKSRHVPRTSGGLLKMAGSCIWKQRVIANFKYILFKLTVQVFIFPLKRSLKSLGSLKWSKKVQWISKLCLG